MKAELHCDIGQQLVCAESRLKWHAEYKPEVVPRLLVQTISSFPDHLIHLRVVALRVDALDHFIDCVARQCAQLATKTDRREFRARLEPEMSVAEREHFDRALGAEWHRLRGSKPESNK
ncbi:hypothetical protein AB4Y43_07055 [Paraburkholderia sp. BR10872]|uniref:hypothetical protein n=1 Tax=Paraburkholderia sp. BR10872 TaxID=3236989 RepID=UPI0034D272B0